MKQFLITLIACLVALFVASVLFFITSISIIVGFMSAISDQTASSIKPNSVLKIELSEIITDEPNPSVLGGFDPMTFTVTPSLTMLDILTAIEAAEMDENIKGIYLRIDPGMSIGIANTQELRAALAKFRDSGKFVVSYNDTYTQSTYYLSSVANNVFITPEGNLDWIGMSSQVMFFKGALDKLGITPEIVRCGEFKSAVEPFINDKMSDESRIQTSKLLGSIWGGIVSDVAASRGIDSATLQKYASDLTINGAKSALDAKLVDNVFYTDMVVDYFKTLLKVEKPEFVTISDYIASSNSPKSNSSKNKVEIIYAEGEIVDGTSKEPGMIGGRTLAQKLSEARENKEVKAVVVRVNSPGGSALASEVIWREMALLQKAKPLVVSMGNYAASGGYYMSAPADVILSSNATITGSIGVFGIMFDAKKAINDKLGVTVDVVKTNTSSDIETIFRPKTTVEKRYMQNRVDSIYNTFVGHVAQGRNLTTDNVLKIASGRVWSGSDAQRVGLVDGTGGIMDAVTLAADRAGVAGDYSTYIATDKVPTFTQAMMTLFSATSSLIKSSTPDMVKEYNEIQNMIKRQGVQAVMPYKMTIQ